MKDMIAAITQSVLYEGYILWPYSRSALKNQRRWTFGGVYPQAWSRAHPDDVSVIRTECLLEAESPIDLSVTVRFLHVVERMIMSGDRFVDATTMNGQHHVAWQEATERTVVVPISVDPAARLDVQLPILVEAGTLHETLGVDDAGRLAAVVRRWGALDGSVEVRGWPVARGVARVGVEVRNGSAMQGDTREDAQRHTFVATHAVLHAARGRFVSPIDPPKHLAGAVAECVNDHVWPVLVGEPPDRSTILASPIILEDYPKVAPESKGDFFDGGEIDQLLVLSVLSLTEAEQQRMRESDPRAREILERCQSMTPDDVMRLHGITRELHDDDPRVRIGQRVRLRPRAGGDIMDSALAGRIATVEAVDVTTDGETHVSVSIDDDPGRDLGGPRYPAHRFFFRADEIELLEENGTDADAPRTLIAGIGNIFFGDDGFGVTVARRLLARSTRQNVTVRDFGIRGLDLAYAMQEGFDTVILVDALARGGEPGTIYVVEPDVSGDAQSFGGTMDAHGLDPVRVLQLARSLGPLPRRVVVVGCEPATIEGNANLDDSFVALSAPVARAVDDAVRVIDGLVPNATAALFS